MTYKYLLFLALLSMGLASCTDWLDIKPDGKIVKEKYWKQESDVNAVLATCYRAMIEPDYVDRLIVYGELRSDNVTIGGTCPEDLKKINASNLLPNNEYSKWKCFYQAINYCNEVIKYAPKIVDPNFTKPKMNARLAEAYTLRALNYFYLVRAFGEVPFITEPSVSDNQIFNVPKSSINLILDSLEVDLLKSEGWAMTSYASDAGSNASYPTIAELNKGRITRSAVRALLADIYLWRNKYEECIFYCDKVIGDKSLELIEAIDKPFTSIFGEKNSTESIFELQYSFYNTTRNTSVENFYGHKLFANPNRYLAVPENIRGTDKEKGNVFSDCFETDVRRKDFIMDKSSTSQYFIFKYPGYEREERINGSTITNDYSSFRSAITDPANWIVYRLTDVMLMKAEALVQKNELAQALKIVNTTFMRSNPTRVSNDTLSVSNYNSKFQMENLVLLERQRELMFEGKRWFDLVRYARRSGRVSQLVTIVSRKYTQDLNSSGIGKLQELDALYFPIHQDEINTNSNLHQYPIYELDSKK